MDYASLCYGPICHTNVSLSPYGLYIKVVDREGFDTGLAGNLSCGNQLRGVCVF